MLVVKEHKKPQILKEKTWRSGQRLTFLKQRPMHLSLLVASSDEESFMAPFSTLERNGPQSVPPIPPIHVALVWITHRLNPTQYEQDCIKLFGFPLPAHDDGNVSGLDYLHASNAEEQSSVTARCNGWFSVKAIQYRLPWKSARLLGRKTVRVQFYLWPPYEAKGRDVLFEERVKECSFKFKGEAYHEVGSKIKIDFNLNQAVERPRNFAYNVHTNYYGEKYIEWCRALSIVSAAY